MEGKGKKGKGMRRAREGKERDQGEGLAGPMSNCFRRACVFCDESCVITADLDSGSVGMCARQRRLSTAMRRPQRHRHLPVFRRLRPRSRPDTLPRSPTSSFSSSCLPYHKGGSVAERLACWTQAQKGPGSNRSRDAVG